MSSPPSEQLAVVLIGHGAPATDCPPQLVGELMSLEWRQVSAPPNGGAGPHRLEEKQSALTGRAAELDADPSIGLTWDELDARMGARWK